MQYKIYLAVLAATFGVVGARPGVALSSEVTSAVSEIPSPVFTPRAHTWAYHSANDVELSAHEPARTTSRLHHKLRPIPPLPGQSIGDMEVRSPLNNTNNDEDEALIARDPYPPMAEVMTQQNYQHRHSMWFFQILGISWNEGRFRHNVNRCFNIRELEVLRSPNGAFKLSGWGIFHHSPQRFAQCLDTAIAQCGGPLHASGALSGDDGTGRNGGVFEALRHRKGFQAREALSADVQISEEPRDDNDNNNSTLSTRDDNDDNNNTLSTRNDDDNNNNTLSTRAVTPLATISIGPTGKEKHHKYSFSIQAFGWDVGKLHKPLGQCIETESCDITGFGKDNDRGWIRIDGVVRARAHLPLDEVLMCLDRSVLAAGGPAHVTDTWVNRPTICPPKDNRSG